MWDVTTGGKLGEGVRARLHYTCKSVIIPKTKSVKKKKGWNFKIESKNKINSCSLKIQKKID